MKILLNYNFDPKDILDKDYPKLFYKRRRDSIFAFVFEEDEYFYAFRDHLGNVPLFYRFDGRRVHFSLNLSDLVKPRDQINKRGLRFLLGFSTCKLFPLIRGIKIVPPGTVIKINKKSKKVAIVFQYRICPTKLPFWWGISSYVARLDQLLFQAVKRGVRQKRVGLYLSGGIDSALTGIYLKKLGIMVNAYTTAPWGRKSSEIPFARMNAKKIAAKKHFLDILESEDYEKALPFIPELYKMPHGTSVSLAVTMLWRRTPIVKEKQIFFGQGSDTITCTVYHQYLAYLASFLPPFFVRRFVPAMRFRDPLANYFALISNTLLSAVHLSDYVKAQRTLSKIQQLTLAGSYIAHIPSDGEALSQPAIQKGILIADPYYDMDVVEFFLGVPLWLRIGLSKKLPLVVRFEKQLMRKLALKYFPRAVVFRKKGYTIPLERDAVAQRFVDTLPRRIINIELTTSELRLAAKILENWLQHKQLARIKYG